MSDLHNTVPTVNTKGGQWYRCVECGKDGLGGVSGDCNAK